MKILTISAIIALALIAPQSRFLTDLHGQDAQTTGKIEDLITKLQKGDVDERQRAAIALGTEGGANALEPLIGALDDQDDFVRDFAVKALGNIGDSRALEALVKALKDQSMLVRRSAATALGNLGDPAALDPLIETLNNGYFMVRRSAARALGNLGDPKAVDPLIEALGDKDVYIQNSAVFALTEIGEPALPKLISALGNWTIGPRAAEILQNLNWAPSSDQEKIQFDVAKRDKQALLDNWETAQKVLLADAKSENNLQAQNAVFAMIGIGQDELVEELVRILGERGDAKMAKAFLHCGNDSLIEAARDWTARHKEEEIEQDNAEVIVEWGGMSASQIEGNIASAM